MHPAGAPAERNLRLYPWLHAGSNALFWLPTFVLYFSSLLAPADVLRLEALYYCAVVALEVPSGYLSDRLGRRPTLIVATCAAVAGNLAFAGASSFALLALGQGLFAVGRAFQSGTDTALLFDSLHAVGRPEELASREAAAHRVGYGTLAVSALAGGLLGALDLRLGYLLSALGGLVAVAAAVGSVEPPATEPAHGVRAQAHQVLRLLGDPVLRWTLGGTIGFVVIVHVPYELLQPWLLEVLGDRPFATTTATSGVVTFVTFGIGAVAAGFAPRLLAGLGPARALLVCWALITGVLSAMALGPWAWLVPVIALRSVPVSLSRVVLTAVAQPRVPTRVRATWFSVESLLGRLGFAAVLALGAQLVGAADGWTWPTMLALLQPMVLASAAIGLALWALRPRATSRWPRPPPPRG